VNRTSDSPLAIDATRSRFSASPLFKNRSKTSGRAVDSPVMIFHLLFAVTIAAADPSSSPLPGLPGAADHQHVMWYRETPAPKGVEPKPVTSPAEWAIRRAAIMQGLQAAMGDLPDRSHLPPLDIQTTETFTGDGYQRHTISFANLFNERVTAYLYIPANIPTGEKRPAVLSLQPTGMPGKEIPDGRGPYKMNRAYALELAQRGYVVISPDYPSFGDQKDYDFAHSPYKSGSMKAISDNMRCLDLLTARNDVDPRKIACIGHSLGGHNTLFTAAFDPRIAVAVTSCGWTPFHFYYGGKKLNNWAQDRYMPRVRDVFGNSPDHMPFDFPEVLAAIAPRPVYSNSPLKDANFDFEGVKVGIAEAQKIYTLLGASGNLVVRYPDYPHDFPDESRREACRFIDSHLHVKPVREVP
jgi:pimeloyl-ACP methyl ester carboxylesterase